MCVSNIHVHMQISEKHMVRVIYLYIHMSKISGKNYLLRIYFWKHTLKL
jgi:hypothetical protein